MTVEVVDGCLQVSGSVDELEVLAGCCLEAIADEGEAWGSLAGMELRVVCA